MNLTTPEIIPFHPDGDHSHTDVRWRLGRKDPEDNRPGSALIGWAAWLLGLLAAGLLFVSFSGQYLYIFAARRQHAASVIEAAMFDVGMIIFSLLALGLSRAGKPARAERLLIIACAAGSAVMNYAAADDASPRSVIAFTAAPVFLAIVVDRVIAVIRRHVLADDEASAWAALGTVAAAAARLAGTVLLYWLRFVLDAPETAKGLRRMVLNAAPLPEPQAGVHTVPEGDEAAYPTKKAAFLAAYRKHAAYGDRSAASRVAAEIAPAAGLQPGTGRTYVIEELNRLEAAAAKRELNGGAS